METLAERFKAARVAAGLTQQQLADEAGISKQAISKIERGETTAPEAATLDPIARRMQVTVAHLLHGERNQRARIATAEWADILASPQVVSAGDGAEAQEYAETYKLKFRAESLRRQGLHADKLVVYYARGDSMEPRIRKGDAIMFDTSDTRPVDDTIYVVQHQGELYAKRANIIEGKVYFQSDNPSGDHNWRKPRRMDDPKQPIEVLGRVRWIGSWER